MKKLLVNVGAVILGVLMTILVLASMVIAIPLMITADTLDGIVAVRKGREVEPLLDTDGIELSDFIKDCIKPIKMVIEVWKS